MRRTGVALLTVVVAIGGVVLLLLFLQGRDDSQIDVATSGGPGQALAGGELPEDLRASGARAEPSDADIEDLLRRGNVVLVYGQARPPAELTALAREIAGPPDPALEASGQAIVLARRPGVDGVVALAWERIDRVSDPADPALAEFARYWLGRGAAAD